jgi:DNA-binding MarR family transcriptional regulator
MAHPNLMAELKYRLFPEHITADLEQKYRQRMHALIGDHEAGTLNVFRNLMKASGMVGALHEKRLARHNLSTAKMRLLFWLAMRDEEGLMPSELGKMQGIMPNTVTSLVSGLRDAGLVEQGSHPDDRRKKIIRITAAGKAAIRELAPSHNEFIELVFAHLTHEQLDTLNTLLLSLIDRARQLEESTAESEGGDRDQS